MKSVSGVGSKGEDRCRGGWHRWAVDVRFRARACAVCLEGFYGELDMLVSTSAFLASVLR